MMRSVPLVTAVLFLHTSLIRADDEYRPSVAAASKDAELALQGFLIPEGMKGSLLAAEPGVANPVTFHLPPLANLSDGPSGLTFYPGLGLSDRYRDHFFLADFRGAAANSGIRSFAVKPAGASFTPVDAHQFIWSILATDVDFAPDGSLYVSDWVNGWVGERKGRLYRFEDTDEISAVKGAGVQKLLNGGVSASTLAQLTALLSHEDRRVRQSAQFELAHRGAHAHLMDLLPSTTDEITRRHISWVLWQSGLQSLEVAKQVVQLCQSTVGRADAEGIQYSRILADLVDRHGLEKVMSPQTRQALRQELRKSLSSDRSRHAGFAAAALGKIGSPDDVVALTGLADRNSDSDAVIRHQVVMGLAGIAERSPQSLASAVAHQNPRRPPRRRSFPHS